MKRFVCCLMIFILPLCAELLVRVITQLDLQRNALLPSFSADGSNILFSSDDGLYRYETASGRILRYAESGYDPVMDREGVIRYRADRYEKGRRLSAVVAYDSRSEKSATLIADMRPDMAPRITDHGVYYVEKQRILSDRLQSAQLSEPVAFSWENAVVLHSYGTSKVLKPAGERPHLWPSVSPLRDRLCVVGGNDLYVSDLSGNVLFTLADARAPQWSPDGRWIAFMRDRDDGHVITGSEIHLVSSDGSVELQLTDSADLHEMYPQWSPDGRQIICDEVQTGKPVLITLEIK